MAQEDVKEAPNYSTPSRTSHYTIQQHYPLYRRVHIRYVGIGLQY